MGTHFYVWLFVSLNSSDSFFYFSTHFFFSQHSYFILINKGINNQIYLNMDNWMPPLPLHEEFPWNLCPISLFSLIVVPPFPLSPWNDDDVKVIFEPPRGHTWNVCPLSLFLFPLKCVPQFPISFEICSHFPYFPCRWHSLTSGIVERFHWLQLNVTWLVPCPYVTTFSEDQFSLWI